MSSQSRRINRSLTLGLAFMVTAGVASADIVFFTEDFSGDLLDPAWALQGDAAGHIGLNGSGQYRISDTDSSQSRLSHEIDDDGSASSYINSIELDLTGFSSSVFFWKSFGSQGFAEVVVTDNGAIRMFTNVGGNGNLFNTNIGVTTGDSLDLRQTFDQTAGTMSLDYSLNGAGFVSLYSGLGNASTAFTDVVTGRVQFQVGNSTSVDVLIDQWNVVAIPEPATAGLLGLGGLLLALRRRRRFGSAAS